METTIKNIQGRQYQPLRLLISFLLFFIIFSLAPTSFAAPDSFVELAKKSSPSVVNISTVKIVKGGGAFFPQFPGGHPFQDFFDFFEKFQQTPYPKEYKQQSLGTGFIIGKDGHILTNNHVVEQADGITVKLSDNTEFEAKVIGRDPKTDLALIKIETNSELSPLQFGDSDALEIGEWVIAIGNPFGLGHTVTAGIVSAKFRRLVAGSYDNFIQTDASINPGNSGGPLLNIKGEVVGINTAIFSKNGGSVGIGFAIPINMAKDLLPQLEKGKIIRGWLGVSIQEITPELKDKLALKSVEGVLVGDVVSNSPAEKAGIERGDVIVSFDNKEIKEVNDLPYIVASTPTDSVVDLKLIRNGKEKTIKVTVGMLKDDEEPPASGETAAFNLGITLENLTPQLSKKFGIQEQNGVIVMQVEPGSIASEIGIRSGDIILEIDHQSIKNVDQFYKILGEFKEEDTLLLLIKRRGSTHYLTLQIKK